MNKLERCEQAKKWVRYIETEHSDEIQHSITNSTRYRSNPILEITSNITNDTVMSVDDINTIQAIFKYRKKYPGHRIAALNFASYKHPGGGFLAGMYAQEESLCHQSTLYGVLRSYNHVYYEPHKSSLNRGLYGHDILYTPDIWFQKIPGYEDTYCDIITCAAPNWGAARRNGVTEQELMDVFGERILSILRIAEITHVDILILGAFGCGVFKNTPSMVATLFKSIISKCNSTLMHAIFAIPDKYSTNYKIFNHIITGEEINYYAIKD